jgi:hypothetical protein
MGERASFTPAPGGANLHAFDPLLFMARMQRKVERLGFENRPLVGLPPERP